MTERTDQQKRILRLTKLAGEIIQAAGEQVHRIGGQKIVIQRGAQRFLVTAMDFDGAPEDPDLGHLLLKTATRASPAQHYDWINSAGRCTEFSILWNDGKRYRVTIKAEDVG